MFMWFYIFKIVNFFKFFVSLYLLIICIMFICLVLIGMWGYINFLDLVGIEVDRIFFMMLIEYILIGIVLLVMVGVLVVFMLIFDF